MSQPFIPLGYLAHDNTSDGAFEAGKLKTRIKGASSYSTALHLAGNQFDGDVFNKRIRRRLQCY